MAKKTQTLGELELEIMKVLWDRGRCSVLQVAEVLSKPKGYSRTIILTTMQRLHRKGYLKRTKEIHVYRYEPAKKRNQVMGTLLNDFIERVFDGTSNDLMRQLTSTKSGREY